MPVTPYVGVWIEINGEYYNVTQDRVTPYVGVWIEIKTITLALSAMSSLPMWECGLKYL